MEKPWLQWIDGEWTPARDGRRWEVQDPSTEEIVRAVPFGSGADADDAISAAHRAGRAWAAETPYARGAILAAAAAAARTRADELAALTTRESGKPTPEARGEWLVAADLLDWFAEEGKRAYGRTIPARRAGKRMLVLREPVGVVGVITAWNFPAYNPARAWAAALAAGCTVVARPSEYTPMTAMALAGLLADAGLPKGVLNLVNGDPEAMGAAMLARPEVRKISFTGSVRVGRLLLGGASRNFTRLGLDGGNAPVLVFPDVDVARVARGAVAAKFRNAGQVCIAPQRFLVHQEIAGAFAAAVEAEAAALKVGPGAEAGTQVGPLINARQRDRVEALVAEARRQGAEVRTGGRRPAGRERGFFYEPTVLGAVRPGMGVFDEEVFGPVMPLSTFTDLAEGLALANSTPYGLAAYVWTDDLKTAMRAWEGLDAGMIGVNEWTPQAVEAPFAGRKQSGLGHEAGAEGLADYLETKLVSIGGI